MDIPGLALCNAFCTQRWPCGPGDGRVMWACMTTRPPTCDGCPHVPTLSHDTRHTASHLRPRSPTKWTSTLTFWASIRISCGPPTLCTMALHMTCTVEPRYTSRGPPTHTTGLPLSRLMWASTFVGWLPTFRQVGHPQIPSWAPTKFRGGPN